MYLPTVLSLVDHSSCRLKVISSSGLRSEHIRDFGNLLEAIPSLEHLSLCCWRYDEELELDHLFKCLCNTSPSTGTSSQFLPRLQMLDVRVPFSDFLGPCACHLLLIPMGPTFSSRQFDMEDSKVPQLLQLLKGRKLRIYI